MSDVPVEHEIEVLERGRSRVDGNHTSCVLGQELRFDRGALERCSNSRLDYLDVDLLVVLASVAFADRRVCRRRGSSVIGLDELASKATSVAEESGHLTEIARALGRPQGEIAWRVARLLRQHADEWRALNLVDTLPEGSWVRGLVLAQKGNR